jgi:Holliday junction resolvase-like predicted endonuclease
VSEVDAWAAALNAHVVVELRLDGERPLVDARHAAIQDWVVRLLRGTGWLVDSEVGFNHYGDRGRIDVLAYHPALRLLLVIEVKTRIEDVQDVLGRMDVKRRIASNLARERDRHVTAVVPALLVMEGRTARRHVAAHEGLFGGFDLRARGAIAWMKRPARPAPSGILAFVRPSR